jgi:hypothetical protein
MIRGFVILDLALYTTWALDLCWIMALSEREKQEWEALLQLA